MSDRVYDSHNFVKRLNEAGMPEQQAEVLAVENMQIMTEILVTKADLRALETKMDRQFAELRSEFAELRSEFAELRSEFAELRSEFAEVRSEFAELRADFTVLRADSTVGLAKLENRLETIENRLLMRLGGLVVAVQAAALVIGKLF